MNIKKRRAGRTSVEVTEIGLGAGTLGGNVEGGVSADVARDISAVAYDAARRFVVALQQAFQPPRDRQIEAGKERFRRLRRRGHGSPALSPAASRPA